MATYYLNASYGNDSGAGTGASPWLTVSKFVTSGASLDTLILQGTSVHYTWASQVWDKPMSIMANTLGDAILDGAAGTFQWSTIRGLSLTNLIFEDHTGHANGVFQWSSAADHLVQATNCIFRDIQLQQNALTQGGLFSSTSNHTFGHLVNLDKCIIDVTKNSAEAEITPIFCQRLAENSIYNIRETTIYLAGTSAAATQLGGIFLLTSPTNAKVNMRNTVISAPTTGVSLTHNGSFTGVSLLTNDFHNIRGVTTGTAQATGNITSDPLFVDAANDNFDPQQTSPLINAGTLI